ncbi:MAG: hypothetical protein ABSF33_20090 [Acidimicrobiales bacterium]|jgi:hypothetical protein
MTRLTNLALALSAIGMAAIGLHTVPADAGTTAGQQSVLVGELGIEGGAAPGGFRPTAGTVQVEFKSVPLVLERHVGGSGHFDIKLSPGTYTVIGCGPAASGTASGQCSKPKNVHLVSGEVDHLHLVWALAP